MSALTRLIVADMQAGGPGSGCRGPRCGRPHSNVKQSFKSPQGFTYTLYKASRKGIQHGQQTKKRYHELKSFSSKRLKGSFKLARMPQTNVPISYQDRERWSHIYDAKFGRGDVYEGHGITVIVHRDYKNLRMVVQEYPHDELDHSATAKVFKFKNFMKGAGFLKERYGIKQKWPKQGQVG